MVWTRGGRERKENIQNNRFCAVVGRGVEDYARTTIFHAQAPYRSDRGEIENYQKDSVAAWRIPSLDGWISTWQVW